MIKFKIDVDNEVFENLITLEPKFFPNGERIYTLPEYQPSDTLLFMLQYESDADLFALLGYCASVTNKKILYLPYLPYGRADRLVDNKMPTIQAVAAILNACKFSEIVIQEPHNAEAIIPLLNSDVDIFTPYHHWSLIIKTNEITHICFPDAGAKQRYENIIADIHPELQTITIAKKRNITTGAIESIELEESQDLSGAKILIIDDICSKGGTFMGAGDLLKKQGAEQVFLYVNYCERTVYDGELLGTKSPIDMLYVYEYNSVGIFNTEKLHILPHFLD